MFTCSVTETWKRETAAAALRQVAPSDVPPSPHVESHQDGQPSSPHNEFGPLRQLSGHLIVTYSYQSIFVINPADQKLLAALTLPYSQQCQLRDVATSQTTREVFAIFGERTVLRVGFEAPEESLLQAVPSELDVKLAGSTSV